MFDFLAQTGASGCASRGTTSRNGECSAAGILRLMNANPDHFPIATSARTLACRRPGIAPGTAGSLRRVRRRTPRC